MNPAFDVRYADSTREDLLRLFDFLLDRARTAEDFDSVQFAVDEIRDAVERSLSRSPFVYRKAGKSQAWNVGNRVACSAAFLRRRRQDGRR